MLELTEFPYLPSGDPSRALSALVYACRAIPPEGEPIRNFRRRMKEQRLWDSDRIRGTFLFLGIEESENIVPSEFVRTLVAQKADAKARDALTKRLWDINPLLFKSILDLLKERVYSRDDVFKYVDSVAYPGKKIVRPQLEGWLHMAMGLEVLKMVGIALDLGARGQAYLEQAAALDVEEFLEDVARAESDGDAAGASSKPAPSFADDDEGDTAGEPSDMDSASDEMPNQASDEASDEASDAPAAAAAVVPAAAMSSASAPAPAARPAPASLASPRGRERPAPVTAFAGQTVFSAEILEETAQRIQAWWSEQAVERSGATVADFGIEPAHWAEGGEEALYRIAVAAALAFRLGGNRSTVKRAFQALERTGVLSDLYYGTAPEVLPERVDPKALMLASLVARRCAETPELAASLERQTSAAQAFEVLDQALGRGLFKIELFWMMGALHELGALRFDDIEQFTALPSRRVRDTLYRLGFIGSPYAHDAAGLIPAAAAAYRAAGSAGPPDEVLASFAIAAGCAYDCQHRRSCEYACRERTE